MRLWFFATDHFIVVRRFPVLALVSASANLACLEVHHAGMLFLCSILSPGTQSCGVVLDRPAKLAKLWSRHLPHPRCPAARTFDSSSLCFRIRIPQWRGISNGVLEFCHTQTRQRDGVISGTPAGLESTTPQMRNLRIAGWLWKRVSRSVLAACETLCRTQGCSSSMTVKWAS